MKHALHPALGIAGAGGGAGWEDLVDRVEFLRGQRDFHRDEDLAESVERFGAGDRDYVLALRQQPGEAELRHGAAPVGGDGFEAFDMGPVFGEILALEAWVTAAGVAGGEVVEVGHHPGEQAAPERRVGDKRDAEIASDGTGLDPDLLVKQRVFALHRGDRVHLVRSGDALGLRLAEAEMPDLALLDQAGHRADRVLDRHRRIDPVLKINVDVVGLQPFEARFAGLLHVFGPAIDAVGAARVLRLAEFRDQHDLVAPALQRAAEQFLVLAPAIHVRAVEKIDAEIDRLLHQRHAGRVVARPVDPRQRHAAEPDRGDLRPVLADPTLLCSHQCLRCVAASIEDCPKRPRVFVTNGWHALCGTL